MTYESLMDQVKLIYKNADASNVQEHVAIQFNVQGPAEGTFYLEVDDGKVNIQPYKYYDEDVLITASVEILLDMLGGKTDVGQVYAMRNADFAGNLHKAALLRNIII